MPNPASASSTSTNHELMKMMTTLFKLGCISPSSCPSILDSPLLPMSLLVSYYYLTQTIISISFYCDDRGQLAASLRYLSGDSGGGRQAGSVVDIMFLEETADRRQWQR
jgi:hypothetical protein